MSHKFNQNYLPGNCYTLLLHMMCSSISQKQIQLNRMYLIQFDRLQLKYVAVPGKISQMVDMELHTPRCREGNSH